MTTDQTCHHGYHHCNECKAEILHRKASAALKFDPTLVVRFKKDLLGLPVFWGPVQISKAPKAGQVLMTISPTELEGQDPPGVIRGED